MTNSIAQNRTAKRVPAGMVEVRIPSNRPVVAKLRRMAKAEGVPVEILTGRLVTQALAARRTIPVGMVEIQVSLDRQLADKLHSMASAKGVPVELLAGRLAMEGVRSRALG